MKSDYAIIYLIGGIDLSIETASMKVNVSLVEVENAEDATHAFVIEDHLQLGFTSNKLYELHKNEWKTYDYDGEVNMEEYFALDDNGNDNFGIINCVKSKLCKLVIG